MRKRQFKKEGKVEGKGLSTIDLCARSSAGMGVTMKDNIASRQIHLDFHTSEKIEGVCAEFDAEVFADTLEKAHVNSVTLFSCCHHGMLYYDSKLFPEMVHPHLAHRDLLREQAAACHRHGIAVNLYTTIRWNKPAADAHPDWVCIDEYGALQDYKGKKYFEAGFYKNLCVNTPYREFLKKQFGEVLETVPAEGVWYDAAFANECCCPVCQRMMRERSMNPADREDRKKFALMTHYDMVSDLSAYAKSFHSDYNVCFNKGHIGYLDKPVKDAYSYFSFESLPGEEWGYLDFPVSAKYMRNFGKECLGLTSRFHTEWGDFHAFRNRAAMEFEVFSMLANGCKCTIGDQMDYWGVLNPDMYRQIGQVYESVERKEPWCLGSVPLSEIGVFTAEEFFADGTAGEIPGAGEGVTRLLIELGFQFDFIDSTSILEKYRLLILPDVIPINKSFAEKLKTYLTEGGKLIASWHSGLTPEGNTFAFPDMAVIYKGEAPYSPDFIFPKEHLEKGLESAEHVMYDRGTLVEAVEGAEFIQMAVRPVFNRSYEHFCSHMHSPSAREEAYPAIVETTKTAYFIHPVFTTYQRIAPPWYKKLFQNEVERMLEEPYVSHNGPSTVITNLLRQDKENRHILHILHYVPIRKCKNLDIVEDIIPLHHVEITLYIGESAGKIYEAPYGRELAFNQEKVSSGRYRIVFVVPEVRGHHMTVIERI